MEDRVSSSATLDGLNTDKPLTDKAGTVFDADLHVTEEGVPQYTRAGNFKKLADQKPKDDTQDEDADKPVTVEATHRGYYGTLREPGDVFEVCCKKMVGSWMKVVG